MQVLKADEVAPGITFQELQTRRDALAALLPVGAVALVPSATQHFKSGVIPFPFRQDADFLWLTGVQQQGLAIFHKLSESRTPLTPHLHASAYAHEHELQASVCCVSCRGGPVGGP